MMSSHDEDLQAIRELLPAAKQRGIALGGRHPMWQIILDAEALVEERRTVHRGGREELAKSFRQFLEQNLSTA